MDEFDVPNQAGTEAVDEVGTDAIGDAPALVAFVATEGDSG
ncbi:MAG TPA: hypothetical protein VFT82_04225 [Candidatus Paceibacterota bacterium]|nr:hypothetical protein [Candidatus Paceibacterota bacterium]